MRLGNNFSGKSFLLSLLAISFLVVVFSSSSVSALPTYSSCPDISVTVTPLSDAPPEIVSFTLDATAYVECVVNAFKSDPNYQSVRDQGYEITYDYSYGDGTSDTFSNYYHVSTPVIDSFTHTYSSYSNARYLPSISVSVDAWYSTTQEIYITDPIFLDSSNVWKTLVLADASMVMFHGFDGTSSNGYEVNNNGVWTTDFSSVNFEVGNPYTFRALFSWRGATSANYSLMALGAGDIFQSTGFLTAYLNTNPLSSTAVDEYKTITFTPTKAGTYGIYGQGSSYSGQEQWAYDAENSNIFTVVDNTPPPAQPTIITVDSPNGGENWTVGDAHPITWHSEGNPIDNVNIDLCRTGTSCVTWESIASNVANTGSYSWTVSGSGTTTNAYVRVTDVANNSVTDMSNAAFTVYKTLPPPTQDPCSLSGATASWSTSSATEGATITLTLQGTSNCIGQAVLFDVWEDDTAPNADDAVTTNPSSATVGSGGSATTTWTAEYQDDTDGLESNPPEYYFRATISGVGTVTSSNPELTVNQQAPFCSSVTTCADYPDSSTCNGDTCSVASASVPSVTCSDPNIDCFCTWNTQTSTCDSGWTDNTPPPSDCGDGIIQAGEQCDGTNWGTTITGCANFDSFTGGTLSCNPTTCQFDTSQCTGGNGEGICGNNIVNIGETCDGTDWGPITSCNDFDEFTGGILDCTPQGDTNECQFDTTQCSGGEANSTGVGKCIYTQQSTGDTCEDGFLSLSWIATWVWDENNTEHKDPQNLQAKCVDGSKTVECPAQIALPFFEVYNLIVALILVGVVYWVLSVRGKHHRKRR